MAGEALDVFISYSHRDEGLKDELVNYHLKLLQREGKINTWLDRNIEAGAEWAEEIRLNLEKADIVLLLITRHFLASDYCYETEMQRAVQRHYEGNTRVIPIILETCGWKYTDFKHLQVLPKDGKPVTSWANQADAFFDVEEGIRRVVEALNAARRQSQEAERAQIEAELKQRREAEKLRQDREAAAKQEQKRQAAEQRRREQEAERLQQEAEAEGLRQQQTEAERQEQVRQEQEKRQREEAETQLIKQERQERTLPALEQPQEQEKEIEQKILNEDSSSIASAEPLESGDKPGKQNEQERFIEKMATWEIPVNRRTILFGLIGGGIGGWLILGSTPNEGTNQEEKALALKSFNFAVVSLNTQGQEISRVQKENKYFVEDLGQGIGLDMVTIPGGSFLMGSPDGEGYSDERPQHRVTVKPFFMGKFLVTQAQWEVVAAMPKVERGLNPNPSTFQGLMRPVEEVAWHDAVEFCQRLSRHSKRDYRLPSEAEWEYACRAGTTTPFSFGPTITTDLSNFQGEYTYGFASKGVARQETTEVGSFAPNGFGLYDMHGNVWEWCEDHWHDNYQGAPRFGSPWIFNYEAKPRILRGGSWYDDPKKCRSASRYRKDPNLIGSIFGFRVVCSA